MQIWGQRSSCNHQEEGEGQMKLKLRKCGDFVSRRQYKTLESKTEQDIGIKASESGKKKLRGIFYLS